MDAATSVPPAGGAGAPVAGAGGVLPAGGSLVSPEDEALTYALPNPHFPGLRSLGDGRRPFFEVDSFLTDEEIEKLKAMAAPGLTTSIVVDGKDGKTAAPSRTSRSCFLPKAGTEWLAEKVAALTGKPAEHQEPPQVANYQKDQLYAPHFDAFDVTTAPGMECALTGGQRVATVLVYMNDCERGGGTYFPKLDLRVQPRKGKMFMFFPCDVLGRLDSMMLHTGEAAVEEKWLCQVWIRQTDFARRLKA